MSAFSMRAARRALLRAVTHDAMLPVLRAAAPHAASIFMLHRFEDPERGSAVDDVVRQALSGEPIPRNTVVFTVDDGYADFMGAAPIFAEFDCPVTVFLIVGFLDGRCWNWSDQVLHAFTRTERPHVTIPFGDGVDHYVVSDIASRVVSATTFIERLKRGSDSARRASLAALPAATGVEIRATPTLEYAPLSWDDVRRCEGRGARFGAHTVTHPVLSAIPEEDSEREIRDSLARVAAEVTSPSPVFCYPYGEPWSFGHREEAVCARTDLIGAVSTSQASVTTETFSTPGAQFAVPRYPWVDETDALKKATGLETLQRRIRVRVRALID
jgi:peptidoglycan/xylan/chitin deacetylase (PgdA/CDA1 family)